MLHNNDIAVLRAAKAQPDLVLWDEYGYPTHKASRILAEQLNKDEVDVYYSLKFLESVDAFEPGFDPKKPLKNKGGFFSLSDIGNPDAKPIELPPLKKTDASKIVDRAITEHLSRIPAPEYITEHCPEGGHDVLVGKPQNFSKPELLKILEPLAEAMRQLAPMFPEPERFTWMNRVSATLDYLRKIVDGHQTEFSYPQLQLILSLSSRAFATTYRAIFATHVLAAVSDNGIRATFAALRLAVDFRIPFAPPLGLFASSTSISENGAVVNVNSFVINRLGVMLTRVTLTLAYSLKGTYALRKRQTSKQTTN